MHSPLHTVTLALSGASGMAYGLRLLECLLAADVRVYLLVSQAAHLVAKQELGVALPARAGDLETQLSEGLNASLAVLALARHLPSRHFGPVSLSVLAAFGHVGG
ncbi:MAG: hypothetical protein M1449_01655, partial [Candidatus Thermoplasmatota archaeon]|nr:hypothetical protein [Candidatus Thermoplasmatota archaeon]